MTSVSELKESVSVCMFDQYGTIVDMQGGLRAVAAGFLREKGSVVDPDAFVTWWRRTHFENSMIDALLGLAHTPYREIGHLSVRQVMDRAGIAHSEAEVRFLVGSIERLTCFPEVPAALDRLRGRYRLAVLSNGDPDMLEAALPWHGVMFDAVISVAEANAFKPARATYEMAAARMGVGVEAVLFVANHEFDCVGAKAAGMRTVFVDRRRRPFARWVHQPDLVVGSMAELGVLLG
nr:haloacid dehalogenase type II [uncultured Rhodopila sp.]